MRWVLPALLAAGLLVWFARPFSVDLLRYGAWRATEGRAFVNGSVVSEGARIDYRTIGPLGKITPATATAVKRTVGQPPLVLLHGGFGTDLDWYAEIPTLARHHALVLIDTRGHGRSTLGDLPLSYELFARDVIAVLDVLGLDTVDVAGWSDGGNTGLLLAREHSARMRRLVAISVNAHPGGLVPKVRAVLVRGRIGKAVPGRLLRAALSPEPGRRKELVANIRSLWRNHPVLDAADLRAIGTPTPIIAGSEDDIRRGHLDDIVREMPDAMLAVLPGVGHAVPQSAPERVLELMTDFLDRAGDTHAPDSASRSVSS